MSTSKKLVLKRQMLPSVSILFQPMVTVVSLLSCSPGAGEMLSSDAISTFCCQSLPTYYCQDGCDAADGEVKEPRPQTQATVCMLAFGRRVITDTLWFTVVFSMRSGSFACPVAFSATSGTAKSSEKLWLEIHRIVFWYCLYIVCMMRSRTVITILVAG